MAFEFKIPEVGESITEGLLVEWSIDDGGIVAVDDPVLVLETDKITMTVTTDRGGQLSILVPAGETVEVGQIVATIDEAVTALSTPPPSSTRNESDPTGPPVSDDDKDVDMTGLSPAVRKMLLDLHLDPAVITGTGKEGRILKGDVLRFLAEGKEAVVSEPAQPVDQPAAKPSQPATAAIKSGARQTREPMSRLRQRLAERLVEVQQTAAILTTFNEVDMSSIMELRSRYKEIFAQRHEVGLGFMSFFVKATVEALKTVPAVNAFIENGELVTNHYYDIGIAVSSERGLVVPVIRDADTSSMATIEKSIKNLAAKAQNRTLELSDLSGGVITISNGGIFGSVLSTPILNPPQSAILGMHAIKKRPIVVDDEIVIRPMMNLALSYDHRLIDGREAVTFLKRIVDCLENPERLLLEV